MRKIEEAAIHWMRRFFDSTWASWASLFLVALRIYWIAFEATYLNDDWVFARAGRENGPWQFWIHGPFFRPLASLTFYLFDHWRLGAVGLVLAGVCLNIGSAFFLRSLVRRTGDWIGLKGRWADILGFTAAFVFLSNSAHTEAVDWASCINDTMCLFFGLWALNVYWRAFALARESKNFLAPMLGGAMLFCLALLCKEDAVWFPVIAWLGAILNLRKSPLVWASLLGFTTDFAFVEVRARFLGHVIGGYGGSIDLIPQNSTEQHNFMVSFNNSLLPVGHQVVPLLGENWMSWLTVLFVTSAACMGCYWMDKPHHEWIHGQRGQFTKRLIVQALLFLVASVLSVQLFEDAYLIGIGAGTALLTSITIWLNWELAWVRRLTAAIFYLAAAVSLYLSSSVFHTLLIAISAGLFSTLIRLQPKETSPLTGRLLLAGGAAFFSMLLFLLLQANIGQQYWGENVRLSYEASAFGAVVLVVSILLICKGLVRLSAFFAFVVAGGFSVLLFSNNVEWLQNYQITQKLSTAIRRTSGPRAYILVAPSRLLNAGSEDMGWVVSNGRVETRLAALAFGYSIEDVMKVGRLKDGRHLLRYLPSEKVFRPLAPFLRVAAPLDPHWFSASAGFGEGEAELRDFQEGDSVLVVSRDRVLDVAGSRRSPTGS